jgi:hypothetical protein
VSGGDTSQNGASAAPPPPPRPPGSPFGRFLQNPVLLVGFVALMISLPIAVLSVRGSGDSSPAGNGGLPAEPGVVGSWAGSTAGIVPTDTEEVVVLEIRSLDEGGTMTRRFTGTTCRGDLRYRDTAGERVEFDYVARRVAKGCPRRSLVVLEPVGDDQLRFRETRGERLVAEGVLRATDR